MTLPYEHLTPDCILDAAESIGFCCDGRLQALNSYQNRDALRSLGRFIGRMHAVGSIKPFMHRPLLDIESFGREPSSFVLDHEFLPADLRAVYRSVVSDMLGRVARCYDRAGKAGSIRLHGDCHAGNILWTEQGPHFVDLDDARMGPAVQDISTRRAAGRTTS